MLGEAKNRHGGWGETVGRGKVDEEGHDGEGETTTGAVGYIYTPPKSHTRFLNLARLMSLVNGGWHMAKHEKLSGAEEGEILVGISKSLPLKAAAEYAGVEWGRLERLMVKDDALRGRLAQAVAKEQARVMELMKLKSGDVKALSFLLERVYGLSTVEVKENKKEKMGNGALTITPAVLKALASGQEKVLAKHARN